jgi:peptidylprolyl isomerase
MKSVGKFRNRGPARGFTSLWVLCALAPGACKSEPEEPKSRPAAEAESKAAQTVQPPPAAASSAASTASAAAPTGAGAPIPAPPDVAAPPKDSTRTKTGLSYKVLSAGSGKQHPTPVDKVKVHYTGWTKEGRMFDSSLTRGEPIVFAVTQVIPGWTEGLQLMVAGEKRRLWIPSKLAYGERPMAGAPAGDLVFDIELLEIIQPLEAPKDLKKPPADAKKTASGLVYKFLKHGAGKEHPKPASVATVNYSGWTKDGKMFDSSVVRGTPARFSVDGVIKGWTEGLELMVAGDQLRLWIPADLAYGQKPTRPGAPVGDLVFDVELVEFH